MHDYALWGTVPSEASDYPDSLPDSAGIPEAVGDGILVAPFNDAETAVALIDEYADELGGVIVEPLQRVLTPVPGFLEAVREACTRHGIVLIFDEIVTGFRIAWGGAQERYGVVPDVATFGKAIAGGFPLAAIVGKDEVMEAFDGGPRPNTEIAWSSGTFSGNPIAATAGIAGLEVLSRPGVYERPARNRLSLTNRDRGGRPSGTAFRRGRWARMRCSVSGSSKTRASPRGWTSRRMTPHSVTAGRSSASNAGCS